jgi:hypothetical protein
MIACLSAESPRARHCPEERPGREESVGKTQRLPRTQRRGIGSRNLPSSWPAFRRNIQFGKEKELPAKRRSGRDKVLETELPEAGEKLTRSGAVFTPFDEIESIPGYRHQPTPRQR